MKRETKKTKDERRVTTGETRLFDSIFSIFLASLSTEKKKKKNSNAYIYISELNVWQFDAVWACFSKPVFCFFVSAVGAPWNLYASIFIFAFYFFVKHQSSSGLFFSNKSLTTARNDCARKTMPSVKSKVHSTEYIVATSNSPPPFLGLFRPKKMLTFV